MIVGVGLGPGDPTLLTLQAVQVLSDCDVVFVPGERAANLVKPYNNDVRVVRAPMTEDSVVLRKFWGEFADQVAPLARDTMVGYGVIGDPNFFSTFNYLREVLHDMYPDVVVESVPGVSIVTAFASRLNEGVDSSFEVSDGSPKSTRIILKALRPQEAADDAREDGYNRITLLENLFTEEENVSDELPVESDYFTVLFARR